MTLGLAEARRPAPTVDGFLDGRITLVQPESGHRAGLDAALLQALVPASASGAAVDLGAGVGTVAFAIAARAARLSAVGIERDPELVACANAALKMPANAAFAGRLRMVQADLTDRGALRDSGLAARSADWALMNPPFDQPGRVRASPDPRRRTAHVGEAGALRAWCETAAALLKPGGLLGLIHRARALPEVLEALEGQFAEIRILPIYPFDGSSARRILVRARRASRAGLELASGLVLHNAEGGWTPLADAILRGQAELPL
jgi:tRNA1(Val) A37 N6-methylase TrmN6